MADVVPTDIANNNQGPYSLSGMTFYRQISSQWCLEAARLEAIMIRATEKI